MADEAEKAPGGLTLAEAKKLGGSLVYGLADEAGAIFYVGQTRAPRSRFQAHSEKATTNRGLKARLTTLGKNVRVIVLQANPDDLTLAEREEIRKREPNLVNIVGADDAAWAKYSAVPWGAGAGVLCPSSYALTRCRPHIRDEIRERLAALTPAQRCAHELNLLASWPEELQRRFKRWYAGCRDKMLACLQEAEVADGAA